MKKKIFTATIGVLALSGALLIGNSAAGSAFLDNMVKGEEITYQESGDFTPITVSHAVVSNESNAPVSVPKLNIDAKIPIETSKDYLANDMTEEDFQMIYNYLDNSKKEADDVTRQMTDDEINRRRILWDKYDYDGLRPENKLPFEKGNNEYYYDLETQTSYLPDRALTDEELLQFIDWASRVNYAINLRNKELLPQPGPKDITEEEAVAKASDRVTTLFNIELSELKVISNFYESYPTNSGRWSIMFSPYKSETLLAKGETYWQYWVEIDSLTGEIKSMNKWCSKNNESAITEEHSKQIKNDKSWVETAKKIITEQLGEARKIKNAAIQFEPVYRPELDEKRNAQKSTTIAAGTAPLDDSAAYRAIVTVVITLEDNSVYIATLQYPDKSLNTLTYTKEQ